MHYWKSALRDILVKHVTRSLQLRILSLLLSWNKRSKNSRLQRKKQPLAWISTFINAKCGGVISSYPLRSFPVLLSIDFDLNSFFFEAGFKSLIVSLFTVHHSQGDYSRWLALSSLRSFASPHTLKKNHFLRSRETSKSEVFDEFHRHSPTFIRRWYDTHANSYAADTFQ